MKFRKGIIDGIVDAFCGSYEEAEPARGVTITELIRRKTSVVRVGKKHYRVTVEPVQLQVKPEAKA